MKITTFTCKNCGANVTVPDAPGTVICTYCGSSHRVSFEDGSVVAELVAKVKQLSEDVGRLASGRPPAKRPPSLGDRLAMIAEGKRKWHEYFSLVKAGKGKKSPEVLIVFKEAQANLIGGYGSASGPLIEDAYNAELVGLDPPAGYSCLFMMIGVIVLSTVTGLIALYGSDVKVGIILLGVSAAGIVAGIPFIFVGIRSDKRSIRKRQEALVRLGEIEREIGRRLNAGKGR